MAEQYTITLAVNAENNVTLEQAEEFSFWLKFNGHNVIIDDSTNSVNRINGISIKEDENTRALFEQILYDYFHSFNLLNIGMSEISLDIQNRLFIIKFSNDKKLQCSLVSEDSWYENIDDRTIHQDKNNHDKGLNKEVNEWAVTQGLASWPEINRFLIKEARHFGIKIIGQDLVNKKTKEVGFLFGTETYSAKRFNKFEPVQKKMIDMLTTRIKEVLTNVQYMTCYFFRVDKNGYDEGLEGKISCAEICLHNLKDNQTYSINLIICRDFEWPDDYYFSGSSTSQDIEINIFDTVDAVYLMFYLANYFKLTLKQIPLTRNIYELEIKFC